MFHLVTEGAVVSEIREVAIADAEEKNKKDSTETKKKPIKDSSVSLKLTFLQ